MRYQNPSGVAGCNVAPGASRTRRQSEVIVDESKVRQVGFNEAAKVYADNLSARCSHDVHAVGTAVFCKVGRKQLREFPLHSSGCGLPGNELFRSERSARFLGVSGTNSGEEQTPVRRCHASDELPFIYILSTSARVGKPFLGLSLTSSRPSNPRQLRESVDGDFWPWNNGTKITRLVSVSYADKVFG
jgi:hypothetical protein